MRNHTTRDDSYGTLLRAVNDKHIRSARALLARAIKQGLLDAPYVNVDAKHRGDALNYDLYDAKDGVALYQHRYTVCSKYGNSPTKSYLLVYRDRRGVRLEWLNDSAKSRVVKIAKVSKVLGEVINTLTGVSKRPLKLPSTGERAKPPHRAYKIVEARDGSYLSVYNSEHEWSLNKLQSEASTPDHSGGFYVYATKRQAMDALTANKVFAAAWQTGKQLALLRCEVSGREYAHGGDKLCVTRCKPVALVQYLRNPL